MREDVVSMIVIGDKFHSGVFCHFGRQVRYDRRSARSPVPIVPKLFSWNPPGPLCSIGYGMTYKSLSSDGYLSANPDD